MRLRALSTTLRSLRARTTASAAASGVAHVAPCFPAAAPRQRLFLSSSRPAAAHNHRRPLSPLCRLRPPPFAARSAPASASAADAASSSSRPPTVEVDVRIDGSPLIDGFDALREAPSGAELQELAAQLEADAAAAAAAALRYASAASAADDAAAVAPSDALRPPSILSLVLCDDAAIAALNEEWRGVEGPTDVLSFPQTSSSGLWGSSGGEGGGGGPAAALPWEVISQFQGGEQADPVEYDDEVDDEIDDDEIEGSGEAADEEKTHLLPPRVLGDLVLSLDTAQRQALERGHSLRSECRVLLVHGALHLLGFDHEGGGEEDGDAAGIEEQAEEMARAERAILKELGWDGEGLIDAAPKASERAGQGGGGGGGSPSSSSSSTSTTTKKPSPRRPSQPPKAKAVAIDLDGTLLTSSSRACLEGVAAAAAAADAGVAVIISTGKARPAAALALEKAGFGGGLLVGPERPGVFLQGLASYGRRGRRVGGMTGGGGDDEGSPSSSFPSLPPSVVRAAFAFAARSPGVSAVAFTGDECFTLAVTRDTDELHSVYHEPLPRVPSGGIEELLFAGEGEESASLLSSPVLKMLFVAEPARVESELKPVWRDLLSGKKTSSPSSSPEFLVPAGVAAPMQAVSNMLELVPAGVDKGLGLEAVLRDLGIDPVDAVAVGDGGNDLPMLRVVGTPVAMGNAVAEVKGAARHVVGSNDERGVAEAIERFVL